MNPSLNTVFRVAAKTDSGVKRQHNEDNYMLCYNLDAPQWSQADKYDVAIGNKGALLVIADGMGGVKGGKMAAEIAINSIKKHFSQLSHVEENIDFFKKTLSNALIFAHQQIAANASQNPTLSNMGTTCCIAWLYKNHVIVGWVGDSRVYLLRNGTLSALTKDHSLVQTMIDKGEITSEQALTHARRNEITQSLGGGGSPMPECMYLPLMVNDRILLCTDGLNTMVSDNGIQHILTAQGGEDISTISQNLVETANKYGGLDNITVIVADVTVIAQSAWQVVSAAQTFATNPVRTTPIVVKKSASLGMIVGIAAMVCALGGGAWYFSKTPIPKPEPLVVTPPPLPATPQVSESTPSGKVVGNEYIIEGTKKPEDKPVSKKPTPKKEEKPITHVVPTTEPALVPALKPEPPKKEEPKKEEIKKIEPQVATSAYYIRYSCYEKNEVLEAAKKDLTKKNIQHRAIKCGNKTCIVLGKGSGYKTKEDAEKEAQKIDIKYEILTLNCN